MFDRGHFIPPSGANAFTVSENIIPILFVEEASLVKNSQIDENWSRLNAFCHDSFFKCPLIH